MPFGGSVGKGFTGLINEVNSRDTLNNVKITIPGFLMMFLDLYDKYRKEIRKNRETRKIIRTGLLSIQGTP